jgi:hypothetical protein
MKLQERIQQPTPPFFKDIRKAGLTLAAVSAAILSTPIALPALLVKVAGYAAVAGSVASAVSQTAVCKEPTKKKSDGRTTTKRR